MSDAAVLWAVRQRKAGTPTTRMVLVELAESADEHGRTEIWTKQLHHRTNLTYPTIRTAMRRLQDMKLVEIERQQQTRNPGIYRLNMGAHR